MNVILTSAGRRTTLLKAFKAASNQRGGKVFAGDIDGLAPALFLADGAIKLPTVLGNNYIPFLLETVKQYDIRVIVPTIDTELLILAENAHEFKKAGCVPLISSREAVRITGDKWETVTLFKEKGIRVPHSWLPEHVAGDSLPGSIFIKPRNGSASRDTYHLQIDRLEQFLPQVPNPIIQEAIKGEEITIDALLDLQGNPLHYVPRLRIKTIGGESVEGVTISDRKLRDWILEVLRITAEIGGQGPITVQAFLTEDGPVLSEINLRFGGGIPLTLMSGGNYAEWVLQMVEGKKVPPRIGEYAVNQYMSRYYVEHFTQEPAWQ